MLTKAKEASKEYKIAEIKEQIQLEIAAKEAEKMLKDESITSAELVQILEPKYGTVNYEEDGETIKSITTKDDNYEIPISEIWSGTIAKPGLIIVADGSFCYGGGLNGRNIKRIRKS